MIKKPNAHKSKPRRVLYVIRGVEGGLPVVADHLVRGLNRNRYVPIVLFETNGQSSIRKSLSESKIKTIDLKKCGDYHPPAFSTPQKNLNLSGRINSIFGKEPRKIYLSLRSFYKFLCEQAPRIRSFVRVIRENRVDLVHSHYNLNTGKPEFIAAWITGIPCISHIHGIYQFNSFDRMFSRFVDTFIFISRYVAECHTSQLKPRVKGTIIHNGVDMEEFTRPYGNVSVREEFGIASDQTLVGIVGRIDHWKGHDFFLEAIAEASQQISGLKGLIVGKLEESASHFDLNSSYFRRLQCLIRSMHLEDKIIFTGFRNDVPRLMSDLDIVVHASTMPEPFGLVVIEGMAAGKPVIATAAGGVLDIIEDEVNGFLIPPKDSKAMALAIMKIISNPDLAKQMGATARHYVANKFTIQHQLASLQELYDSILSIP